MVEIVADGGREQDAEVLPGHALPQLGEVNHAVHHLTHAEAVPEVVKGVVAVIFLHTQLQPQDGHEQTEQEQSQTTSAQYDSFNTNTKSKQNKKKLSYFGDLW